MSSQKKYKKSLKCSKKKTKKHFNWKFPIPSQLGKLYLRMKIMWWSWKLLDGHGAEIYRIRSVVLFLLITSYIYMAWYSVKWFSYDGFLISATFQKQSELLSWAAILCTDPVKTRKHRDRFLNLHEQERNQIEVQLRERWEVEYYCHHERKKLSSKAQIIDSCYLFT